MANFPHAWVGYDNLVMSRKILPGTEDPAYPLANLKNWYSWQRWKPGDDPSVVTWGVTIDCGVTGGIADYAAVLSHSGIETFVVAGKNNLSDPWTDIVQLVMSANAATYGGLYTYNGAQIYRSIKKTDKNIAVRFDQTNYRYYFFWFKGTVAPSVGVLALGKALDFPRGFYGGFIRPAWNKDVETTNSISERGQFLGRSIVRSGNRPFVITQTHVTHGWVDTYWQPFREHADLFPFVFVWEPNPVDLINGTINNTDVLQAWLRAWRPSTLKDKRFAEVGGEFEGAAS